MIFAHVLPIHTHESYIIMIAAWASACGRGPSAFSRPERRCAYPVLALTYAS